MEPQDELVEIYCARNEMQAKLIEAALTDADIRCRVVGHLLSGAIGELPPGIATSPAVWVPADQAEQAQAIIRQLEQPTSPFRVATWTCPKCDTEVESDFNTCWNCLYCPTAC